MHSGDRNTNSKEQEQHQQSIDDISSPALSPLSSPSGRTQKQHQQKGLKTPLALRATIGSLRLRPMIPEYILNNEYNITQHTCDPETCKCSRHIMITKKTEQKEPQHERQTEQTAPQLQSELQPSKEFFSKYQPKKKAMKDVFAILNEGMPVEAAYAFCDVWDTQCETSLQLLSECWYSIRIWFYVLCTMVLFILSSYTGFNKAMDYVYSSRVSEYFTNLYPLLFAKKPHSSNEQDGVGSSSNNGNKSNGKRGSHPGIDIVNVGVVERMSSIVEDYVRDIKPEGDEDMNVDEITPVYRQQNGKRANMVELKYNNSNGDDDQFTDALSTLPSTNSNFNSKSKVRMERASHQSSGSKGYRPNFKHLATSPVTPNPIEQQLLHDYDNNKNNNNRNGNGNDDNNTNSNTTSKTFKKFPKVMVNSIKQAARKVRVSTPISFSSFIHNNNNNNNNTNNANNEDVHKFEAKFETKANIKQCTNQLVKLLKGPGFKCDVSCDKKKWSNKFKLRVVSLYEDIGSILVTRFVIEEKKKDENGKRKKNLGSIITIYPARFGSGETATVGKNLLPPADVHFNSFVQDVKTNFDNIHDQTYVL